MVGRIFYPHPNTSDLELVALRQDHHEQHPGRDDNPPRHFHRRKSVHGHTPIMGDLEQGKSTEVFRNGDIMTVGWAGLTVTVTDRATGEDKTILEDANGLVRPGEMVAIMGPSGSGKTTLLNTIAQRQTGKVKGTVYINGSDRDLATHRSISSFVEQEDTLTGSLTTRETLGFAAKLALPRSVTKSEVENRVETVLEAFGLQKQARTLIGTPLQKGLSGGQKRRVSVAMQLLTAPRVLYLDEPTSGLDSKASYEIMSYISKIAKDYGLIVIASIHQPSAKTFRLFDQISLLTQGKMCYFGPTGELPAFFQACGNPMPRLTNPVEHALEILNVDFNTNDYDQTRVDNLVANWKLSDTSTKLQTNITLATTQYLVQKINDPSIHKPSPFHQLPILIHRALIKSYRDIVTYWVRVVMYMGLAIMMGTVWLRLGTDQKNIQPFINAIFFGSAFMSFMAVAYVPAFLEDRAIFTKERANGLYGPTVFLLANFLVGLPYLFLISVLFSIVAYWLTAFTPTASAFFTWILWLFLDLLAAESLVVLLASLYPNFVVALALIAFANGLWMSVGGFLVALPVLNVFWKYVFHYIDYQAYVFQGMMVNEFKGRVYDCEQLSEAEGGGCHCLYPSALQGECKIAGEAVLRAYGYATGKEGEWVGIMIGIIVVYRLLGWVVTFLRKT